MGRIENFIPVLKKHRFDKNQSISLIEFDGVEPILLEEEVVAFVRQINGHSSLKEIFLHLNEKCNSFSIEKSLQMLRYFASQSLLVNHEDYFKLTVGGGSVQRSPKLKNITSSYFTQERLISLLQKTTLFLKCDRSAAETILSHSTLVEAKEGVKIIEANTKSSSFYILLLGEVGVYRDSECLANLGTLSIFGESAAILDQTRNADVVSSTSSWLLEIDASKLVDTNAPESFDPFKGLKSRLILNQTLAANPLFRGLPTDILQFFISKCRIEKYGREQTVIEQGTSSGDFYFILKGSVAVVKDGIPVTSLSEGNYFGEVAAIFRTARTASILCETTCTFLALNQKELFEVLCSHFRLATDIEKTAKLRMNSKGNVLQLFEDDEEKDDTTNDLSMVRESNVSQFEIDQDFLEHSQTNFDLQVFDFSNSGDEEAS